MMQIILIIIKIFKNISFYSKFEIVIYLKFIKIFTGAPLNNFTVRPFVTAQLSPNRKCYQLSQPEIEFDVMERCVWHCAEKMSFLSKDD